MSGHNHENVGHIGSKLQNMKLDEYINSLRGTCEERTAYLGLDKDREIAYMKNHKYRFKHVLASIPRSSSPIRLLDIGTTPFTLFIKNVYPHYEVSALDLTDLLEQRCKAVKIQFKTCEVGEQSLPFEDNYFDVVIFTEVLEHLFAPPNEVLKEIRRVIRHGGKLIFSVPNLVALLKRIKIVLGISPFAPADKRMKKQTHGYGHLTEYTMTEIASILEGCDFIISKKKFLEPSPIDALVRLDDGFFHALGRSVYCAIALSIPSFRRTLWFECTKPV